MDTKFCSKGKHWTTVDNFHKDRRRTDGLMSSCRDHRYDARTFERKSKRRLPNKRDLRVLNVRVSKDTKAGVEYLSDAYLVAQSVIVERALHKYIVDNLSIAARERQKRLKKGA